MRCCVFLGVVAVLLAAPLYRAASVDDVVHAEVSKAILWEAFWEGAETLGGTHYRPGSNFAVRVISTQTRLYAILGSLHMVVDIATKGTDYRVQSLGIVRPPATTNAEATEWFFRMQGQMGSGASPPARRNPIRKQAQQFRPAVLVHPRRLAFCRVIHSPSHFQH